MLPSQPSPAALLRAAVDPAVAVVSLVACALWFDGRFGGSHLILALLVFSITFPGNLARDTEKALELALGIASEWLAMVALLLLLGWASGTLANFDARAILAWVVATPLALFAAHRLVPVLLPRLLAAEGLQRTAVIVGANGLGRDLGAHLRDRPLTGIRFAGYFDDRATPRDGDAGARRNLGNLGQLAEYVRAQHIDMIYITLPMTAQPRILALLEALHDTTASIYFAPDIFLCDLIQARVQTIGGLPVLAVCESPFYGMDGLLKRAIDIVLASAILVLIAPLMLAIALAVKHSSPGPVLFKQRRYGLDGREIFVYKFRSMSALEDGGVVTQATRGDPRVTPLGAVLRKYSLDELPQFVNVLQGRMSVVGPRPHAVAHNEMYRKLIPSYMVRHKVRPGITGLAQVNGLRGETDTLEKMRARVEYDLAYLRNWSPLLDLKIVLMTVVVVLRKQNAY
ncbi:MAG TPA: undecaprenyl-phosphate glucose phosphotransferase [Burkholderiales bacterium]|nr:undecaprenyl-phosphate glucose phosphotransferase [Burkholderiales bacterium]